MSLSVRFGRPFTASLLGFASLCTLGARVALAAEPTTAAEPSPTKAPPATTMKAAPASSAAPSASAVSMDAAPGTASTAGSAKAAASAPPSGPMPSATPSTTTPSPLKTGTPDGASSTVSTSPAVTPEAPAPVPAQATVPIEATSTPTATETATATPAEPKKDEPKHDDKPWYERIHVRGYTQMRYNRLLESNPDLRNAQGDKSIGGNNGFALRRARLILSGDMSSHVALYFQTDFANTISDSLHAAQLRDLYADIFLDDKKQFRFRAGLSKVPYGFENMQSSSNRAPLDRSDALNSALNGERDLGVFFYAETVEARKAFKHLVDSGLKGSGDYGVLGVGVYNGQTLNAAEKNDDLHVVARLAYPFKIGEQYVELNAGAYTGKFTVNISDPKTIGGSGGYLDRRVYGAVVVYPQPIGFQAEVNVGEGPELAGSLVRGTRPLHGGYAMLFAKFGQFVPFVRGVLYDGGKKHEANAPRHEVQEVEGGLEVQFGKWLELTAVFNAANRTVNGKEQSGHFGRLQLQLNY